MSNMPFPLVPSKTRKSMAENERELEVRLLQYRKIEVARFPWGRRYHYTITATLTAMLSILAVVEH